VLSKEKIFYEMVLFYVFCKYLMKEALSPFQLFLDSEKNATVINQMANKSRLASEFKLNPDVRVH